MLFRYFSYQTLLKCRAHTSVHKPTRPRAHAPTHPHLHTSSHPHIHTSTHPHAHTSTRPHIHTPTHPHAHTSTPPHIHTSTHPHARTHAAALLDMKLPYRTTCEDIDAINAWYEQYKSIQWRYKALVLWGSSQLAKTEYIKDRFPGVYIHKSVINWSTYNPAVHPMYVCATCAPNCLHAFVA